MIKGEQSQPNDLSSIIPEGENFDDMTMVYVPIHSLNGHTQENAFSELQPMFIELLYKSLQQKDLEHLNLCHVGFITDPSVVQRGICSEKYEDTVPVLVEKNSIFATDYGYLMEAKSYRDERGKAELFLLEYVHTILPYSVYLQDKDRFDYIFPRVLIPRSQQFSIYTPSKTE